MTRRKSFAEHVGALSKPRNAAMVLAVGVVAVTAAVASHYQGIVPAIVLVIVGGMWPALFVIPAMWAHQTSMSTYKQFALLLSVVPGIAILVASYSMSSSHRLHWTSLVLGVAAVCFAFVAIRRRSFYEVEVAPCVHGAAVGALSGMYVDQTFGIHALASSLYGGSSIAAVASLLNGKERL